MYGCKQNDVLSLILLSLMLGSPIFNTADSINSGTKSTNLIQNKSKPDTLQVDLAPVTSDHSNETPYTPISSTSSRPILSFELLLMIR